MLAVREWMEACTRRQLEEKNKEAVTRASSYGLTREEPRVQGTYMHLGMHTAQFGCQQKEQAIKRGTGRLCVRMNVPVLPEVSLLSSDLIPFLAATVEK